MRSIAWITVTVLLLASNATAETVAIEAARDATLIEHPNGELANGSGAWFFAGRNNASMNGRRRGLLYFDVAAALPEHAIIESVSLTLFMQASNVAPREVRLHRVLADWGEGNSSSAGGGGAPSEPGDSTWIHTFYDDEFWRHRGGQFVRRVSARQDVGGNGFHTWNSTNHLAQDVRLWNSAPHKNFGWILIGDETTPQTSKRFASSENPDAALRPVLEVTYRLPGRR